MSVGRRRVRDGARQGALSPQLTRALRAEAQRLALASDPVRAIRAVGDAFAALDAELARIAQVRLEAMRQLRDTGWSYDRIAQETGLSKGRVAQLSREAKRLA